MRIKESYQSRREFWRDMHSHWIFKAVAVTWLLLGVIESVLPFCPHAWSDWLFGLGFLPRWHWRTWVIGLLLLVVFAIFEGGHHQVQRLRGETEGPGGPELWVGYLNGNGPLAIQNFSDANAYNVAPSLGGFSLQQISLLTKADKIQFLKTSNPVKYVTRSDVIMLSLKDSNIVVACMDSDCRNLEYTFGPDPEHQYAGFRFLGKHRIRLS